MFRTIRLFCTNLALVAICLVGGFTCTIMAGQPFSSHPENPRYFQFQGKPMVIITSGEHYGAVLNQDFDYRRYLQTLAQDGLNSTRTFSGCYCEDGRSFNIANNTMAPKSGRLICPWARSSQPGYANGGNKFDLTQFDEAYFRRLKDFITTAGKYGIIVELDLFCPMYDQSMWKLSPMNAANNINGIGNVPLDRVYRLDAEPALLNAQIQMTREIVTQLYEYDNFYYEVCNEPYFGGVQQDWHDRIAEVIAQTESELARKAGTEHSNTPRRHLISWNVANGRQKVNNPSPNYGIFNFHYASPPDTITMNWSLNKPIGMNETGFHGCDDEYYRCEAWEFILGGGALYNNLDYSFTTDTPDGTSQVVHPTPGGGGPEFRKQMGIMAAFVKEFDFIYMEPCREIVAGSEAYVLARSGVEYAVYMRNAAGKTMEITLPPGRYTGFWLNPVTGQRVRIPAGQHRGGVIKLDVPKNITKDAAIRIHRPNGTQTRKITD